MRARVAKQVVSLDPRLEDDAIAWIETVAEFDEVLQH